MSSLPMSFFRFVFATLLSSRSARCGHRLCSAILHEDNLHLQLLCTAHPDSSLAIHLHSSCCANFAWIQFCSCDPSHFFTCWDTAVEVAIRSAQNSSLQCTKSGVEERGYHPPLGPNLQEDCGIEWTADCLRSLLRPIGPQEYWTWPPR